MQTANEVAQRRELSYGWAAESELILRTAIEAFLRERMPTARLCHEMVMGAQTVRADVVAIAPEHMAAVEVKGAGDNTTRLLHQVGMFQLCVPEVWVITSQRHRADASLIRHLLPSVGLIVATNMDRDWLRRRYGPLAPLEFEIVAEPEPREPVLRMALEMLWRDELEAVCHILRVGANTRSTRAAMIRDIQALVEREAIFPAIYAALRSRDAQWRADKPIPLDVPRLSKVLQNELPGLGAAS